MNIDPKKIERLQQMEVHELRDLIHRAARSMGMGELRANLLAAAAPTIKKKLETVTEAQLEEAMQKLGEDKVQMLLSQLE